MVDVAIACIDVGFKFAEFLKWIQDQSINYLTIKNCNPETITVEICYYQNGYFRGSSEMKLPYGDSFLYRLWSPLIDRAYIWIEVNGKEYRYLFYVRAKDTDHVTFDQNNKCYFNFKERYSVSKEEAVEVAKEADKNKSQQKQPSPPEGWLGDWF